MFIYFFVYYTAEFGCEKCGKTFKTKQNLETHLASHSIQAKFGCECGKKFKIIHSLKQHKKRCKTVNNV